MKPRILQVMHDDKEHFRRQRTFDSSRYEREQFFLVDGNKRRKLLQEANPQARR